MERNFSNAYYAKSSEWRTTYCIIGCKRTIIGQNKEKKILDHHRRHAWWPSTYRIITCSFHGNIWWWLLFACCTLPVKKDFYVQLQLLREWENALLLSFPGLIWMKGFFFVSIFGKSHHRVIVVGWVFAFKMMIMMNLLSVGWLVGWVTTT